MKPDLSGFGDWTLLRPLRDGSDGTVWLVQQGAACAVARPCPHDAPAMAWLADLAPQLTRAGLAMAPMIPAQSGALVAGGWSLETYLDARPCPANLLHEIDIPLGRFHSFAEALPQRPGMTAALDQPTPADMPDTMAGAIARALAPFRARRLTVIHGDLRGTRVLLRAGAAPVLTGWAQARRDLALIDRAALGTSLSDAETAAALALNLLHLWPRNPLRAQAQLPALLTRLKETPA
ncbi:hypothetical protein [Actibacterium sp. XHP0104]|uniref:hypothetical protein n=1 Tax=Actibacterium sp. XHP0104 TaxID=2984335 RepID=UPI0021E73F9F|nr:hypothetical protein [Actibacterium sp. XHP0104]MCV2880892.1 hypothetical protein [Actibacterium sp. XHP0104]